MSVINYSNKQYSFNYSNAYSYSGSTGSAGSTCYGGSIAYCGSTAMNGSMSGISSIGAVGNSENAKNIEEIIEKYSSGDITYEEVRDLLKQSDVLNFIDYGSDEKISFTYNEKNYIFYNISGPGNVKGFDKKIKRDQDMYKVLKSIYNLIYLRNYNEEFKETIIQAAKIYKNQILKSLYSPFIEFEYKKFIDNIKSMQ